MFFKRKSVHPIQKHASPDDLSPQDRVDLIQLVSHPGYDVLRRMMERVCENFEAKLINSSEPQEVIANQALAKAAYTFYNTVTAKIEYEIAEQKADQAPEPETQEDFADFYMEN